MLVPYSTSLRPGKVLIGCRFCPFCYEFQFEPHSPNSKNINLNKKVGFPPIPESGHKCAKPHILHRKPHFLRRSIFLLSQTEIHNPFGTEGPSSCTGRTDQIAMPKPWLVPLMILHRSSSDATSPHFLLALLMAVQRINFIFPEKAISGF